MNISLINKVILITGSSRGLGYTIAEQLAASGATVAIHANRNIQQAAELADTLPHDAKAFRADLSRAEEIKGLVQEVKSSFGKVDILVNNAAIAEALSPKAEFSNCMENWQKSLQVNLIAAAGLCHLLIPHFIENGDGRIIHIASRAAFRGDTVDYMAYAASKAGLVALSRSIARGYGKNGIKSFVIAPGFINTDMAKPFINQYGEEYVLNDLALPNLTQTTDVAPTVVFLSSGLMDHATGSTIDINAGSYVR